MQHFAPVFTRTVVLGASVAAVASACGREPAPHGTTGGSAGMAVVAAGTAAGGAPGGSGAKDAGGGVSMQAGGRTNGAGAGGARAGDTAMGGAAASLGATAGIGSGGAAPGDAGRGGSAAGASAGGTATGGVSAGGSAGAAGAGKPVVYIGGSNSDATYPFMIYDFDPATGAFSARTPAVDLGKNPSYIALAPSKKFLVVTNESDDAMGGLTSAAIGANGALTKLNHVSGSDGGFTHVAVHPGGAYVFGASYNGGSVSVFPFGTDGMLGPQADNRDFGAMAQTHCVAFDADGTHVLIPNKGNDEVAQLLFSAGTLSPNTPARVAATTGAGPRHIVLHPNGKLAFVINELDSSMTPYQLAANGTLTAGTSVSTLPTGVRGQNTGAHVEISPDGHFLYGSNRGHDSIVVYSVDQTSGALTVLQDTPSGGATPRDFDMDPQGRFIIVANQGDSQVAAFKIGSDGKLTPLGSPVTSSPGCAAVQIAYVQ